MLYNVRLLLLTILFPLLFISQANSATHVDERDPPPSPENEGNQKDAPESDKAKEKQKKPENLEDLEKFATRFDGLFTLYQHNETGSVYLVLDKEQLGKEYIYFSHVVDGIAQVHRSRGIFLGNYIFSIERHFDRIEFVRKSAGYYFDKKSPLSRAAEANRSDALLASEKIAFEDDETKQIAIVTDSAFLSESFFQIKHSKNPDDKKGKKQFSLGKLSDKKSKFNKINSYPLNSIFVVEYVYEDTAPSVRADPEVADSRYVSITIQHSFIECPDNNFQPRFEDPRVGYFTERVTDMTSTHVTPYRDMIHRWHLEKKDPTLALSEPKEPIVWWMENTTPHELRETIKKAVLQWNIAFEKAGFRNAIVVKQQPPNSKWDAGDIRYNVLRWTSSPNPPFGGYGPSFVDPRTGQILGADIMLEFVFMTNRFRRSQIFSSAGLELDGCQHADSRHYCSVGTHLHQTLLFGRHASQALQLDQGEKNRLLREGLYYLALHEVGHTLGLMHNMKASQWLSIEDIHDREQTSIQGLTGSVMDYPMVNYAPPGKQQGNYYTTTPGPYDIWAIQFGYTPPLHDPIQERKRMEALLARSTEHALDFGNDADDMRTPGKAIDPRVMIGDLSKDSITYAVERIKLIHHMFPTLKAKVLKEGESYHRLRDAFIILTREYSDSVNTISRFVGGVYVDRSFVGQTGGGQALTPVAEEDQRRALAALGKYLFAVNAFKIPNEIYGSLQSQRRGFDFFAENEDPKIHNRLLRIQSKVLDHLLHPTVLTRLKDTALYGNEYTQAEMLNDLTDAIIRGDPNGTIDSFRQQLQKNYIARLLKIVGKNGESNYDYTSQSLALFFLKKIKSAFQEFVANDVATQAHMEYVVFSIENALENTD